MSIGNNVAKTAQLFLTTYPAANYLPEYVNDIVNASLKMLSSMKGSPSSALAAGAFILTVQESWQSSYQTLCTLQHLDMFLWHVALASCATTLALLLPCITHCNLNKLREWHSIVLLSLYPSLSPRLVLGSNDVIWSVPSIVWYPTLYASGPLYLLMKWYLIHCVRKFTAHCRLTGIRSPRAGHLQNIR